MVLTELLYAMNFWVRPVLWGWPVLLLILLAGLYYTVLLRGLQIRRAGLWLRRTVGTLFHRSKKDGSGITPFQSVTTALAGSIGTGNIVGVATAITLGGPGAVFWMWISALFGMMTIYGETVLGLLYRKRDKTGKWLGGVMVTLEESLHKKGLAHLFAAACILAALGMGNMTQANAMAAALEESLRIPKLWIGLFLFGLLAVVLTGGIRRIAAVTERVVPIMSVLYLLAGMTVLAVFCRNILPSLLLIFKEAFRFSSALGGVGGYGIARAMESGLSRGIFTNEAGLGSSVMAHAAAETDEPCEQGFWSIFQVFLDTIVVCSVTALCILVTGVCRTGLDAGALSSAAFETVFGVFGRHLMTLCVLFFAFATMLGWSYYGECCVRYLCGQSRFFLRHISLAVTVYRLGYAAAAVAGSTMDLYLLWDLCGCCNGLMALPNLYGLFRLAPEVKAETDRYLKKTDRKKPPDTPAAVRKFFSGH